MKKLFKKELLTEELQLPFNAIEDNITEQSRWSTFHDIVFEYEGKFYSTFYSEGSTESQGEEPWEYEDEVECFEVELKEVLVKKWIPVEKES